MHDKRDAIWDAIWDEVYYNDGYRCQGLIKPGWKVLDVGAHTGSFALLAAEAGADVWAFEPELANFRQLSELAQEFNASAVAAGHPNRITTCNVAVCGGRQLIEGEVAVHRTKTFGHSTTWTGAEYACRQSCWGVPIDAILALTGAVDLLKIDAEGAENEILAHSELLHGSQDRGIVPFARRLLVEWHTISAPDLVGMQDLARGCIEEVYDQIHAWDGQGVTFVHYQRK